jgi:hypothetical protein
MELAPMPVRDAEGVDVRLEERDPPGVDAARAVVVVVCPAVVVVELPALLPAGVLVVDPALALATVVLVVVELVLVLWWAWCAAVVGVDAAVCWLAEGLDDPQAAATNPAAPTAEPRNRRRRRWAVAGVGDGGLVVGGAAGITRRSSVGGVPIVD